MRLGPWLIGLLAILAIWVDIPKHGWTSFPFNCPGICFRLPGSSQGFQMEIKTHLGLDLQGGTQLVLELRPDKLAKPPLIPLSELNTQTRRVIERRINALGVSEPVIQGQGDNRILVELPGVSDLRQAEKVATEQAFLEFKAPDPNKPGEYVSLQPPLTGQNLKPTAVVFIGAAQNEPAISFEFGAPDDARWVQLSKDHVNKQVQITLDGREISAPVIQEVFTSGRGVIQGRFTTQEAKELSLLLNSGALPVPLEIAQSTRIEPTLGRDSVQKSLVAGAIGLLLVAVFMVGYYRLPGALALVALAFYAVLTYALFRLVPVTLTLAGIAGFILSIGMATDANVLTFERLKEELRAGKSLRAAVEEGRVRAFSSIFYSNLATITSASILFAFGTGAVKGFALTLILGVAVSFFTAVLVTQMLLRWAIERPALRRRWLYGVEERTPDATRRPAPAGSGAS
ncbi:MAG TPA: protein translocase subunit SecD [Candidatus Limnocylindria bacterium]|nr:protein translocase subunit SecD [Candidatus Limnocylindria bacterium]